MGSSKGKVQEKKKMKKKNKKATAELFQKDMQKDEVMNEKIKSIENKKRKREGEGEKNVDNGKAVQSSKAEKITKAERESKKNKPKTKKRKNDVINIDLAGKSDLLVTEDEDGFDEQHEELIVKAKEKNRKSKSCKKKRKNEEKNIALIGKSDHHEIEGEDGLDKRHGKSKKSKKKKIDCSTAKESEKIPEKREEAVEDEVYHISSGEEDCSKGMKKWLTEYHQSRPGLKVLQRRIDEFIIVHEEKLEQERKEREARIAEDGWTVVVHHKGRKKTTDSESGITVGSVAPVVAQSQLAKKKRKEVGLEFYRFQKREAQRNEILALQSKFEQDRKRIQQLRAARKFKPY